MSFFRVLLALLISGGIAYGLYIAVDDDRFDNAVEAVRTEVIDPLRARLDPDAATGDDLSEAAAPEMASEEAASLTETVEAATDDAGEEAGAALDTAGEAVQSFAERTQESIASATEAASEATEEVLDSAGNALATTTETVVSTTREALADTTEAVSSATETAVDATQETFASTTEAFSNAADGAVETAQETIASTTEALSNATDTAIETAQETIADTTAALSKATETAVETTQETITDLSSTAGEAVENALPRITTQPAPSDSILPDEGQAPTALAAQDTLPTAQIEASDAVTTEATNALSVVSGGMSYANARETMISAGWEPRIPDLRLDPVDENENALIEAGYPELEGCNDAERPLCRFEFVDGEKRIAAVLTAGTGTDPSVIDAFLMDIRAE